MIITTDHPCGNGRVQWRNHYKVEIEVIAYSKASRYTTFQIHSVERSQELEVILLPDRYFSGNFQHFETCIWGRKGNDTEWFRIPDERVTITPESIRIQLQLTAGEDLEISTEPPRPYTQTSKELYELSRQNPEFCELHLIGSSFEGRPILLLRVGSDIRETGVPGKETKPVILVMSGEHASEFAGEEMTRGMLNAVLEDSEQAQQWRDRYLFDFVLNCNPDGNVHGWHQYNLRDWKSHNYAERIDRSWHHEFADCFRNTGAEPSPETRALVDWINLTQPLFLSSAHSWQGHAGCPGAYRYDPALMQPEMAQVIRHLDSVCTEVTEDYGKEFVLSATQNLTSGHLIDFMITDREVPGYSVEGHAGLGREVLQELGAKYLKGWLSSESPLSSYIAQRFETTTATRV